MAVRTGRPAPVGVELKHAEVKSGNVGLVIDRTYKVYIGGKQLRPDGNYSHPVLNNEG
jgi:hypothetical protein